MENFILITFIMIVVFVSLFFFVKEYLRIQQNNVQIRNIVISGIFLGIFILVNEIWVRNNLVETSVTITLSTIFVLIIFINRNLMYPILISFFTGFLIYFSNSLNVEELFQILSVMIVTMFSFTLSYFKNFLSKNNGLILGVGFIITLLSSLIVALLKMAVNSTEFSAPDMYSVLYDSIVFILIAIIIYIIEAIYIQYDKIETFTTHDEISYYKLSLAQQQLNQKIKFENISYGALLLIELKEFKNNAVLENTLIQFREKVNEKYKNSFFFKATPFFYSVFIPLDLKDIDLEYIKKNNKTVKNLKGTFNEFNTILEDLSTDDIKVRAFGSLYGIDSSSIPELINYASFLMSTKVINKNRSLIVFYDFQRLHETYNTKAAIQSVSNYLSDLKLSLVRSIYDDSIIYPVLKHSNNKSMEYAKRNLTSTKYNILTRNIAFKILSSFEYWGKAQILIPYNIDILSNDKFKAKDLISKIEEFGSPKNVIIGFPSGVISKKTKIILKELRKTGIQFAVINAEKATKTFVDSLNPDYQLNTHVEFKVKNLFQPIRVNEEFKHNDIIKI